MKIDKKKIFCFFEYVGYGIIYLLFFIMCIGFVYCFVMFLDSVYNQQYIDIHGNSHDYIDVERRGNNYFYKDKDGNLIKFELSEIRNGE